MAPRRSQSENAFVTEFSTAKEELDQALAKNKIGAPQSAPEAKASKEINIQEHLMTIQEVADAKATDIAKGLTDAQVQQKLNIHGKNVLTPPPSTPLLLMFFHHLTGFFSLLLWVAAVLCFIAYGLNPENQENMYLGVVLAIVVFLTGVFSFYQDYQSAAVMESFKNFLPPVSTVWRNGKKLEVGSEELVPGDIVEIKYGNKIPCDLRIIEANGFKVNNSSLTGENLPQKRDTENKHSNPLEASNLAFYGTLAESGTCKGICIYTADETVIGKIANLAATTENVETPISLEISHFIKIISGVAIFLGVTFLIIGFAMGLDAINNLVFAIGIIVANVPEGLLATVTVSLTLTAKRMAKKNVLVKNLEAVETLGSTTVIASDKTGTLTQNVMTVIHLYYDGGVKLSTGSGPASFDPSSPSFKQLRVVASLCNNATFDDTPENMAKPIQGRQTHGDASESALLKFCEGVQNVVELRKNNPKLAEIPFNSANKYQVSIHLMDNQWDKPRLLVMKGAPERIYNRCDYVLMDGKHVPVSDEFEAQYGEAMASLMAGGERVLGMCYSELDPNDYPSDFEYNIEEPNFPLEKGQKLVFAGLMSLMDPPRAAVPHAVHNCQSAGIKVIMVTGDHPDTAEAIAKQVHIIEGKTRADVAKARNVPLAEVAIDDDEIRAVVVTGGMLLDLSDRELDMYLDFPEVVFARTSPQQKLRIVQGLQGKTHIRRGFPADAPKPVRHVVAVTGDGVNDSPALKAADIGVAMGLSGSDVAKDAADMILLDDNFASIVAGVEEGRLIFDNLKKSIAYTLSSNIPEISPFLVFIVARIPLPLPTVLILCIDLGTDMVPAISLAYELREANIMQKPPRDMNTERLVTGKLINFSYFQIGVVQACAGFYSYVLVLSDYGFPSSSLFGKSEWFYDNAVRHFDLSDPLAPVMRFCGVMDSEHPDYLMTKADRTEMWKDPAQYEASCNALAEPNDTAWALNTCEFAEGRTNYVCHTVEALHFAQCAFFITIIVVQWADLVACKTRTLSIKHQGMRNGMLNFGLVFETVLGIGLCYIPGLNRVLGTRELEAVHWFCSMPFCIFIFCYDETRKYLMRSRPKGNWIEVNTYY